MIQVYRIIITVIVIIAIILAAFLAVQLLVNGFIYGVVFHRFEAPDPDTELSFRDPDMAGYPYREFFFRCGKNSLTARHFGAGNPKGLIVIAHGIYSRMESQLAEMKAFADQGWQVILFDGTGTARSEGRTLGSIAQRRFDLAALLDCVKAQKEFRGLPVCIYGHSMGAYGAAAVLKTHYKQICAAVCVNGFNLPLEELMQEVTKRIGAASVLERPFIRFWSRILFGREWNASAVEGINASEVPVLLVQGTDDQVIPPETISISAFRGEIRNPNIHVLIRDQEDRNGHATVWLSERAGRYVRQKKEELLELQGRYGGKLPEEITADYELSVDRTLYHELDPEYMRQIETFFAEASRGGRDGYVSESH